MNEILKTTILGLFFGTFGTTIGGILGIVIKKNSNKFLSFILSFASGLMMAVVSFDLIPQSLEISNIYTCVFGVLLGIITMIYCDVIVQNKLSLKRGTNNLLKTGIVVSVGIAIHNFPEGLAIGSGFDASMKLGLSLAIAICLHDIPEGISMAVPMKNGGMSKAKVIIYVILSGVTTGIGAFFGAIVGNISQNIIAICLSFAAGAMLYIVSGELVPESNQLYKGRISGLGNILGFVIGIFATKL